jgi:hypothetical protein
VAGSLELNNELLASVNAGGFLKQLSGSYHYSLHLVHTVESMPKSWVNTDIQQLSNSETDKLLQSESHYRYSTSQSNAGSHEFFSIFKYEAYRKMTETEVHSVVCPAFWLKR